MSILRRDGRDSHISKFQFHLQIAENKKYYASFKIKVLANDAPMACQSFGMQMISPINQAEYDNLRNLLLQQFNNVTDHYDSVAIGGYRSEENNKDWVVHNNKVEYEMDWNDGEPNNYYHDENCLGFYYGTSRRHIDSFVKIFKKTFFRNSKQKSSQIK